MRLILSAYLPNESSWIDSATTSFVKEVCRLKEERGMQWTMQYVKTCRNCIMRALSGSPLDDCPGVSLDKNGIPTAFAEIYYGAEGNHDRLRILLTLFTSLRTITFSPKPDFSTITAPYEGQDDITDQELLKVAHSLKLTNFYRNLVKANGGASPIEFREFHLSTKNGPQGHALLTSNLDATLLPSQLLEYLFSIGGGKLASHLRMIQRHFSFQGTVYAKVSQFILKLKAKRNGSFRKISYFADKEGKTRIIAILDYWSQSALRPLHLVLNRMLRSIKNDCTFNQGQFLSLHINKGANSFHSIDLTAATDRMPITLQQRVLGLFIGADKALAWRKILTEFPFYVKTPEKVETLMKYEAGQPMGAYSSWPAMALTHHFIVRIAALRAGLTAGFKDYFLLGDDLVIANDAVAESYKALIHKLGMPYSRDKTHVSEHTFEFAKRWFHQGREITGFPIGGLISTYHRYPLLAAFLATQEERGWHLHIEGHPDLIRNIFGIMKRNHYIKNKVESSIKLYMIFNSLLDFKRNPAVNEVYDVFFRRISQIANPAHLLQTYGSAKKAFVFLLIKARYELLKSDLENIRKSSKHLDNDRNGWARQIQDITSGGLSRSNFGTRINRHITRPTEQGGLTPTGNPMEAVIFRKMREATLLVDPKNFSDPTQLLPLQTIADGLGKYSLMGRLFSMRSSVSIALAESAITKKILNAIVSQNYLLSDPSNMEVSAILQGAPRSPEMKVLLSGVPILGITRRILPAIRKASIWYSGLTPINMLKAIAVKRIKSTIGISLFSSLIALKLGLSEVVSFIFVIWTAIQALLMGVSILPVSSDFSAQVIGNYLLRAVEILIAGYILSTVANWDLFSSAVHMLFTNYQSGVINLFQFLEGSARVVHAIFVAQAHGVVSVGWEHISGLADGYKKEDLAFFALGSALLYSLTRFIFWILFGM